MHQNPAQPYLDVWLRRTRKQLAVSGRLSEAALILSQREGGSPSEWSRELRFILEGDTTPTIDLVTSIDTILAKPRQSASKAQSPLLI